MAFAARVECDSINEDGQRLTTMVVTYPRCIHAEMLTHRDFSRNSSSGRAIPVEKMIQRIKEDPFIPAEWGTNQKGMQAGEPLGPVAAEDARGEWLDARDFAVDSARYLADLGVHKQIVNRLLEPFGWITVIITATAWDNFFKLRCHPTAQPEMQTIAGMMRTARDASVPEPISTGEWHLPFVTAEEAKQLADRTVASSIEIRDASVWDQLIWIGAGRCARVSYLTHDGRRDLDADNDLARRLERDGHWSPFEHVATPAPGRHANFSGWRSFRNILGH